MSISHNQQWCQRAPEATGLCKHSWTNRRTGSVSPSGQAMDHFGVELVESSRSCCSLPLIRAPEARGRQDAVLPGAELCVPGSPQVYPASATLPQALLWKWKPCSASFIICPVLSSAPYKSQGPLKWIYSTAAFIVVDTSCPPRLQEDMDKPD